MSALDSLRADSQVPLKALGCSFSSYNTRPAARIWLLSWPENYFPHSLLRTTMKHLDISLDVIMKVKVKVAQLCPTLSPHGLYSAWNSPGQNTGVGSLSLLQGIFPTQGLNTGLLLFRWIFYQLSHKGSPRILEWVAYPFSSGSSQPRNGIRVSCIAGRFFTN